MTLDQIVAMTRTHIAQRDYAKHILDTHYAELDKRGELEEWLRRYVHHKRIVEALNKEIPDDI